MPEVIFEGQKLPRKLHPATGTYDGKLYFGCALPVRMSDDIGECFCLVTSDREAFATVEEELQARNLCLAYPSVWMNRWSLDSIKRYTEGNPSPDLKTIMDTLSLKMRELIDLNQEEYELISLWIIGTYMIGVFISYAYLAISGVFRTGKTKLLRFAEQTAFNGLLATDVSVSVLYRLVESLKCTLLLDEAEALSSSERKTELRNILWSGYKEGGKVFRSGKTVGDRIVPEAFSTYSPKGTVTFTGVEQVLADRSIPIVMLRTTKQDLGKRDIDTHDKSWQEIRDSLYTWSLTNWKEVREMYRTLEDVEGVEQRHWELWKPILTLAKMAGEDVYERMKRIAQERVKMSIEENIDESRQMILLRSIKNLVKEDRFYSITEIKQSVIDFLEEGEDTKWLTSRWIGQTLSKSFKITQRKRKSKRSLRHITVDGVKELCNRYGIEFEEEDVYPDEQVKLKVRTLVEQGEEDWAKIYQNVHDTMNFSDIDKVFGWIAEVESDKRNYTFLTECKFEGERTEKGLRTCPLANIPYCAVESPEKCPVAKKAKRDNHPPS